MGKYETCKDIMVEYFASQGITNYPKFDERIQKKIDKNKRYKKVETFQEEKRKYLDFVYLSNEEYNKLIMKFGELNTKKCILALNNYIGSRGQKYVSHYYTIKARAEKDNLKKPVDKTVDTEEKPKAPPMTEAQKEEMKEKLATFRLKMHENGIIRT